MGREKRINYVVTGPMIRIESGTYKESSQEPEAPENSIRGKLMARIKKKD
jgi:hypothetical protein